MTTNKKRPSKIAAFFTTPTPKNPTPTSTPNQPDPSTNQLIIHPTLNNQAQLDLITSQLNQINQPSTIISNSHILPTTPNQTLSQKIAAADQLIKNQTQSTQPKFNPSTQPTTNSDLTPHAFKSSTTLKSAQSKKSRTLAKLRLHTITINFALHSLSADPLLQTILTSEDIHNAFNHTPTSFDPSKPKSQITILYIPKSDLA